MAFPEYTAASTTTAADPLTLRPREAARALGISERKLWGLTKDGKIPFVRFGKAVRYPRHLLLRWLEEQSRVAEVAP
jgi:excisionase family DNA binding protein